MGGGSGSGSGSSSGSGSTEDETKVTYTAGFGTQTVKYVVGESGAAFPEGTWLDKDGNVVADKAALDKLVKADGDVVVLTAKPADPEPEPTPDPEPTPTPGPDPTSTPEPVLEDGWHQGADGGWQYVRDGQPVKGAWLADGGEWYLFDPQGSMVSGWHQDASTGDWYYLSEAHDGSFGAMQVGWVMSAGRWYYLNPNVGGPKGAMMTGWQLVGGQWYYLYPQVDGPKGACAIDTVTPDGYRVDATGAWVR